MNTTQITFNPEALGMVIDALSVLSPDNPQGLDLREILLERCQVAYDDMVPQNDEEEEEIL